MQVIWLGKIGVVGILLDEHNFVIFKESCLSKLRSSSFHRWWMIMHVKLDSCIFAVDCFNFLNPFTSCGWVLVYQFFF